MSNNGLTNNQSHELRLWEEFLARLSELESLRGLDRLKVRLVSECGFSVTVGGIDFTITLPPTVYPLRVTIAQGKGSSKTLSFKDTRYLLLQAITEIEWQICWVDWDKEQRAEIEAQGQPLEEEDEEEREPQAHYLGDKGDVCGFVIYE
ncbi:MAG: hypothetical protein AAB486_03490 [Patescibacteria group bacterium]